MNDEDLELAEILTQISRRTYQEAHNALRAYQNNQNVASVGQVNDCGKRRCPGSCPRFDEHKVVGPDPLQSHILPGPFGRFDITIALRHRDRIVLRAMNNPHGNVRNWMLGWARAVVAIGVGDRGAAEEVDSRVVADPLAFSETQVQDASQAYSARECDWAGVPERPNREVTARAVTDGDHATELNLGNLGQAIDCGGDILERGWPAAPAAKRAVLDLPDVPAEGREKLGGLRRAIEVFRTPAPETPVDQDDRPPHGSDRPMKIGILQRVIPVCEAFTHNPTLQGALWAEGVCRHLPDSRAAWSVRARAQSVESGKTEGWGVTVISSTSVKFNGCELKSVSEL